MNVIEKKYLKVLNASAGSGKTYNLVKDYIKVLLSDKDNSKKFANILAMTFTNMAAMEMKQRIIVGLNSLSLADQKDETKGLLQTLVKETNLSQEEIINNAKAVLKSILHNYEDFSVMTIDKFNLRLIRSFSKELDIPIDFKVELDYKSYVSKIIELMLSKIGAQNYEELTRLVMQYAEENLEDDDKWNFEKNLETLAGQLEKENYQALFDFIENKNYDADEKRLIRDRLRKIEDDFLVLAKEANERMNLSTKEYVGGGNFTGAVRKFLEGFSTVAELPNGHFWNYYSKQKGPQEFVDVLEKIALFFEQYTGDYLFDRKYLQGFNNLALIKLLIAEIKRYKEHEKIIQISEFNKLISNLIQQESTPFIYEKLGTKFHHFLLDEFQDTSKLQWRNMIPLLNESGANGNFNLIVGDPKQSIYRFRNSEAKQFVDLLKNYDETKDELHRDFPLHEIGQSEELKENWRSADEIVDFNNNLFENLRNKLPLEFQDFYSSVHQTAMAKRKGLLEIHIAEEKEEVSFIQQQERVLEIIEECLQDGYSKSDICFLLPKNDSGNTWAKFLRANEHEVVSAESLLIFNDRKVRLTALYLQIRQRPEDQNLLQQFVLMYHQLLDKQFSEKYFHFEEKEETLRKQGRKVRFQDFIATYFESETNFFFRYENLYDLINGFFQLMHWTETSNLELHQLSDVIFEFENNNGPDLHLLNNYLSARKSKLAIQSPERANAIKIMTIHKSKGLEFPVVIAPDFDFTTGLSNKFMLRRGDKVLNTNLSKTSKIEEIAAEQKIEAAKIHLDQLNLMYVAFTRPADRLYLFSLKKSSSEVVNQFKDVIKSNSAVVEEDQKFKLKIGTRTPNQHTNNLEEKTFTPKDNSAQLWFPDIALSKRTEQIELEISDERRLGNQFHFIMSEITSLLDFKEHVDQWIVDGTVAEEFKDRLEEMIGKTFNDPLFQSIFDGAESILSEQAIIIDEENSRRPDKVILKKNETIIIDYKTGAKSKKYEAQLLEYIKLFEQMNYPKVTGYLYYTEENTLQKIGA